MTLDSFIEQLARALARSYEPQRRHRPRRKPAVRPPPKTHRVTYPPQFQSRAAWLLWCERDAASEAQELAMDELMNSARAA